MKLVIGGAWTNDKNSIGRTALDIVMGLPTVSGRAWINDKNSKGQTALDIVMEFPTEDGRALRILRRNGAERGSSIGQPKTDSFGNYLRSEMARTEITEKTLKLVAMLKLGVTTEMRNLILVMAVLVATATYQAVLSPPAGDRDQIPVIVNITSIPDGSSVTNISSNIQGQVLRQKNDFLAFLWLNSLALAASLGLIFCYLPGLLFGMAHLLLLLMSYIVALNVTSPSHKLGSIKWASCILFFLYALGKIVVSRLGNEWPSRRRHSIDDENRFLRNPNIRILALDDPIYSIHRKPIQRILGLLLPLRFIIIIFHSGGFHPRQNN